MYRKLFMSSLYEQASSLFQYGNHICIDNGTTRICHCGNMIFKKSHSVCSKCGSEVIHCNDGEIVILTSPLVHENNHHLFLQKCYNIELLQKTPFTSIQPYIVKIVELSFDYLTLCCSFLEIEAGKINNHKVFYLDELLNNIAEKTDESDLLEERLCSILNTFPSFDFNFIQGIFTLSKDRIKSNALFSRWFMSLLPDIYDHVLTSQNDHFLLSQIFLQHIKLQTTIFDETDALILFPAIVYKQKSYLNYTRIEDFLAKEIFCMTSFQPLWLWFLKYTKTHEVCYLNIIYDVCSLFETAEASLNALEIIVNNNLEEKFLEIKAILVSLKKLKSIQWVINHLWEFFTYDKLDDLCWLYKLQLSEKTFLIPFFEDIETLYAYLKALDKAEDVSHRWIFKTMLALSHTEEQKKIIYNSYGMEYKIP